MTHAHGNRSVHRSTLAALCICGVAAMPALAQQPKVLDETIRPNPIIELLGPVERFVPNEIVVELDPDAALMVEAIGRGAGGLTGIPTLDDIGRGLGVTQWRKQFEGASSADARQRGVRDLSGFYIVRFNAQRVGVEQAMARFLDDPLVVAVEPIGIHPVYATPNDGFYSDQWWLNQANDVDIDGPEAWDIQNGDPSVTVAVLDTGVRYYHKDLGGANASPTNPMGADGNVWLNAAEANGTSGVDDDGNGYIDDWVGWDFVDGASRCVSGEDCSTQDNDPRDFNGHGTHCAGAVAAINNNGYATASPAGGFGNGSLQPTADGVKVMCLRIGWSGRQFGQEAGFVRMDFAAQAFHYAAQNGANIASCSWGSSNSGGLGAAIDAFLGNGGLVFKAAGNSNNSSADYMCGRSDIYCVAATDQNDLKASFSSFGSWVDISAPGQDIMSLYHYNQDPAGDYVATISGTSMSTPITAGCAANVWSQNPGWSAGQVWAQLRDTADPIDGLNPSYAGQLGSGRVNLASALGGTGSFCGDGVLDPGETPCNCPADAGSPPSTETDCSDGIDNDCDGLTDCEDGDCTGDPSCPGCGNGVVDPGETPCNCPEDAGSPPSTETDCSDGIDNDCDGLTDCEDDDCGGDASCQTGSSAIVDCITYTTSGGRNNDKHIAVTVTIVDDLGNPVAGATVSIDLIGNGTSSGTATTDAGGNALFEGKNFPNTCYTTDVTAVSATGLSFDGTEPANGFEKGVDSTPDADCRSGSDGCGSG